MKFTCGRKWLARILGYCKGFDSPSKVLGPSGLVMEVQGDRLTLLLGTSVPSFLEMQVMRSQESSPIKWLEDGRAVAPLKLLADVVDVLSADSLDVSSDSKGGVLEIRHGRNSYVKLFCLADSANSGVGWQTFGEAPSSFTVKRDEFGASVGQVLFAAATDSARPILTGISLVLKGGSMEMIATDGCVMAYSKTPVSGEGAVKTVAEPAFLAWLVKLAHGVGADTLELGFTPKGVFGTVVSDDLVVRAAAAPIQGTFPDMSKFLRENTATVATVGLDDLKNALRSTRAFANGDDKKVRLHLVGGLKVQADDRDGTAAEVLVETEIEGKEQSVWLNSKLFEAAVQAIGPGKARLSVEDSVKPLVIKLLDREMFFVQMPVFVMGR